MRKIDPFKIDLSKLAVSETGVPIGFRELLPEEFPSNGDVFDTHSARDSFEDLTRPRWVLQTNLIGGKSKVAYGEPSKSPGYWFKHYRVLEISDAVPEGYGLVTGGTCKAGDVVVLHTGTVCPPYLKDNNCPVDGYPNCDVYRLQPAFPVAPKAGAFRFGSFPGVWVDTSPKKQFTFDRDYKSGCDKLQVKVNELTIRLRDEQTALGVRTEQLAAVQAQVAAESANAEKHRDRASQLARGVVTLQQDLRDVRYALQASVQEAKQLEDRIETKDAIIKRTSDDCIALSNSLTEAQVAQTKLNCEVSALNARLAEVTHKADHRQDMLNASAEVIEKLNACIAELRSQQTNDTGVGEGYRELRDAELPTARDEFSFATFLNLPRIWSYRGWPSTGPNETYGNLKRELGAGLQYRRKVAAF